MTTELQAAAAEIEAKGRGAEKPIDNLASIRTAVADYMRSEGCSCFRDSAEHEKNAETLGKLLKVEKYEDGSGYDFSKYRTEKE